MVNSQINKQINKPAEVLWLCFPPSRACARRLRAAPLLPRAQEPRVTPGYYSDLRSCCDTREDECCRHALERRRTWSEGGGGGRGAGGGGGLHALLIRADTFWGCSVRQTCGSLRDSGGSDRLRPELGSSSTLGSTFSNVCLERLFLTNMLYLKPRAQISDRKKYICREIIFERGKKTLQAMTRLH